MIVKVKVVIDNWVGIKDNVNIFKVWVGKFSFCNIVIVVWFVFNFICFVVIEVDSVVVGKIWVDSDV